MTEHPLTIRSLRFFTACLISLGAIVYLGPVLDRVLGVQAALGRINNLSLLAIPLFMAGAVAAPAAMRGRRERRVLAALALLLLGATLVSLARYADWIITFGGLSALYAAIFAGLVAYALAKEGFDPGPRLLAFVIATIPALALPIAMIAAAPGAYEDYWLNVYGYSNIRVFGYFAASSVVCLAGLVTAAGLKRAPLLAAIHLTFLVLAWTALFWSGSRAALMAVAVGLLVAWCLFPRRGLVQAPLTGIAAWLGAWISFFLPIPDSAFGIANRVADTARRLGEGGVAEATTGRVEMWIWALEKSWERPLFGHGYLPMAGMRDEGFNFFHSHSVATEYVLSFGYLMGGAMLVLALGLWIRALAGARRDGSQPAMALAALAAMLPAYGMVSATLLFPFHLFVFAIAVGALIGRDVHLRRPVHSPFEAEVDWMWDEVD